MIPRIAPGLEPSRHSIYNRKLSSDKRGTSVLNVKDFGAKGDSVTDDTVAIQAAMDAGFLQAIYFPQGVYKISSTINSPTQARIYGDVRGGSVIDVTANISHLKTKDCFDLYVEQLKFRDPTSLQSNYGAIHIDNLTGGDHQRLYLTDIAIEGCYFGIFNSPLGTRNTFGHVYRSLVMSCRGAGMHLHKTTGFRLYDVLSDHATVPSVEQIDIWFNGVSG